MKLSYVRLVLLCMGLIGGVALVQAQQDIGQEAQFSHSKETIFYPQKGVVCDKKSHFCADKMGISMGYTKLYLGEHEMNELQKIIGGDKKNVDLKSYTLSNGVYCDSKLHRCYNNRQERFKSSKEKARPLGKITSHIQSSLFAD